MKIALVILHADPARGGAERYTVDLAAALARRGNDVSVLASSFADAIQQVHLVQLDHRGATRAGKYLRFLDSLDAHLASNRYDIVHAMLPVRDCDIYHPHAGVAAAALQHFSVHFNPRRRAMAKVEHQLLARANGPVVLCLSEYLKGFVRKHYPLADDRLATLFNAVDLERFDPAVPFAREAGREDVMLRLDTSRPMALMVAQDFERKGLARAIEALARIESEKRPFLFVVGNDNQRPYRQLAARLNVAADVAFDGFSPFPERRYRLADFFVLPTKHDPCSLVVLEALAMGLPVISTRFNGACEIMTDGVHGYVLDDPEDANALADAMRKLMDPQRCQIMSKACLALRPNLAYEHHLDRLAEIYQRVVRQRECSIYC